MNGAENFDPNGQIVFTWRGPRAPRNLIRVYRPDGSIWERVVDLRQNEAVSLVTEFPQAGIYTWYVFPLDMGYRQIGCKEGGPWTFRKGQSTPPAPGP
jgi:hypothetical protein